VERAYRISNLWNWLPAFRTVAETEHLPTAARALHVSPSALSRSVKALEREVGHPLFDREGRRMRLNRAGELLLAAVRDAMRRVDDGLEGATGPATALQIAGPAAWLQWIVLPALHGLPAPADRLIVEMVDPPPEHGERALLRGELDLLLTEQPVASGKLVIDHLGAVSYVLCRPRDAAAELALPFAVWTGTPTPSPTPDPRDVVLRTAHLPVAVDACRAGLAQLLLPLAVARATGLDIRRAVPSPPSQLYLARRAPLGRSAIDLVVERIRAVAAGVLGRPALAAIA
jgi:DNA-binding transcriptional LysR family regulator